MATEETNKGTGSNVEFKGLQAQYLIGFAVGIVSLFFLYVVFSLLKMPPTVNLVLIAIFAAVLVAYIFKFNKKYGQYGLMQNRARAKTAVGTIHYKSLKTKFKNTHL
jgi:MFS superfamily sulfate permease-like transporter